MDGFIKWLTDFNSIYSNVFTLFTIVLSGLISWIISAVYYNIGNRNNLKMSVIYPVCRLLDKEYTRENYDSLYNLSKEYSIRYMKNNEFIQFRLLLDTYHEAILINEYSLYAEVLFSYFKSKLEKKVEFEFIPFEYDGEIIYYDYPHELDCMYAELEVTLSQYSYYSSEENRYTFFEGIDNEIIEIFERNAESVYSIKDTTIFENFVLDKSLNKSKKVKAWKDNFILADNEKNKFKELKICKTLKK